MKKYVLAIPGATYMKYRQVVDMEKKKMKAKKERFDNRNSRLVLNMSLRRAAAATTS